MTICIEKRNKEIKTQCFKRKELSEIRKNGKNLKK
jgi:hypothetical protein